jgi:hypothetical protein
MGLSFEIVKVLQQHHSCSKNRQKGEYDSGRLVLGRIGDATHPLRLLRARRERPGGSRAAERG